MSRIHISIAVAALAGFALTVPVNAAPPTVTPSPGYDARLQEQRAAQTYAAPAYESVLRYPRPRPRHHARRVHEDVY
jgi:hypothetical protein